MSLDDMSPEEKRRIARMRFTQDKEKLSPEIRRTLDGLPSKYQPLYAKVMAGRGSMREAIKSKCFNCCGWEDLKNEVGKCPVVDCELWQHRPYQN